MYVDSKNQVSFGQPVLAHLADAYGRVGRIDEAIKTAQHALDVSRQHEQRGSEAWTLYLLGNVCSYPPAPDLERARAAYRAALTLAHELGMRPL